MSFKENLKEKLKDKLDENKLELLPSGFQAVGDIIILNLKPESIKDKKIIGEKILELYPRIKTVCNKTGIKGKLRIPEIEIIAGKRNTAAIVNENGCKYKFDARKLMFAKGNINERARIAKEVKSGEIVVDMFAGIGYFSIPIGKFSLAKKIIAIELNPVSFDYLKENIKLNKINNIEAIKGDNKKIIKKIKEKADRILMGYIPPPKKFLRTALLVAKKGTVIHYAALISEINFKKELEKTVDELKKEIIGEKFKIKLKKYNFVKNYKPKTGHYTLDLEVF